MGDFFFLRDGPLKGLLDMSLPVSEGYEMGVISNLAVSFIFRPGSKLQSL